MFQRRLMRWSQGKSTPTPCRHANFAPMIPRLAPLSDQYLGCRDSKWQLFTNQSLWDVDHKERQLGMDGATGADLRAAVAAAVQQLNAALPPHRRNYSHHHLLEGRFRTEPAVGTEYLLQLTSLTRPKAVETVRVTRPAGDLHASLLPAYSTSQLIYLVVPYYARPQSLAKFAVQFADLVTAAGENIQMALLFHWSGRPVVSNDQLKQDYARTATALSRINKRVGRRVARLISVKKPFSRGRALLEGAASWGSPGDVLLFLCDVDMVINSRALQRCRANTVAGHSVYYPIVFSTYNPRIFARAHRKETQSLWQHHPIDKSVGFWRDFGYGMTCQYKSDFDAVAGSYLIRNSWGGEDLDLFMHYYHKKYDVVRVPDPDLVHVYHPKLCEQAGELLRSCQNSRIETEASKDTWAKFIYELKQAEANPQELGELLALVEMRDTATTSKTTSATAITKASTVLSNSGNRTTARLPMAEILTRLFSLPRISHKPHRNTS